MPLPSWIYYYSSITLLTKCLPVLLHQPLPTIVISVVSVADAFSLGINNNCNYFGKTRPNFDQFRKRRFSAGGTSTSFVLISSSTSSSSRKSYTSNTSHRNPNESASKQLQSNNHFFSQKSLMDPRFYTVESLNEEKEDEKRWCQDVFVKLCRGSAITRPSRIQAMAWPKILQKHHPACIIADQTGSGKSYAYLIPLILKMKLLQRNTTTSASTAGRAKNAPNVLILTPTSELASQLYNICKKLCKYVPFRTELILSAPFHPHQTDTAFITATNNNTSTTNEASLFQRNQVRTLTNPKKPPVDILVATPGRLASLLRAGHLDFTHLQSLVLDEVDVLMVDETFGPQLKAVGVATPLQTQFLFVTATLPDTIVQSVTREFPTVQLIRGPGLHRVAPTLREELVDVSVPPGVSNRDLAACFQIKAQELSRALRKNKSERTLIFCNTVESCRSIENFLKRQDRRGKLRNVGSYHGAMTNEARTKELEKFCSTTPNDKNNKKGTSANRDRNDDTSIDRILICTDRAARGSFSFFYEKKNPICYAIVCIALLPLCDLTFFTILLFFF
jgi:ATP-dependent RNA helicase DDX18/HAS1